MEDPEKIPDEMTIDEFVRWRIRRELLAGTRIRDIAKSLGVSRWSVWRIASCCNLHHGDNSDDFGLEN